MNTTSNTTEKTLGEKMIAARFEGRTLLFDKKQEIENKVGSYTLENWNKRTCDCEVSGFNNSITVVTDGVLTIQESQEFEIKNVEFVSKDGIPVRIELNNMELILSLIIDGCAIPTTTERVKF